MRAALAAFLLLAAAACARLELRPEAADLDFSLSGRIAARTGSESFSGLLAWQHGAAVDEMVISTPLGQGVAKILRQGGEVTLTTAEPRELRARDAETLTEQALGFRVPLGGLAYWVRGLPQPGRPLREEPGADGLVALEQDGWRVEFLERADGRPVRLRLLYPGIELRLVISRWN